MAEIDSIIHQPVRLQLMALLTALDPGEVFDFTGLRDLLNVTDGNLGAHLLKLEHAGYILQEKVFEARKPKTFISATPQGRLAYEKHVEALQNIIAGAVDEEERNS